jgi:ribosome biogenesis protein NSA1
MKICAGDESGLLKLIDFDPSSAVPNPSKKLKSNTTKPVPVECNIVGSVNKKAAICCMSDLGCDTFMIARLNGIVEEVSFENGKKKYYSKKQYEPSFALNKVNKPLHFIGLHTADNLVITCTDTGVVTYDLIDSNLTAPEGISPCTVSLRQTDLCVMKVHPIFPNIFCTGGYERELCIWDIKLLKDSEKFEPIWKSKNVQNDYLDLRVKVWYTCIVWMHDNGTFGDFNLLVGTGYHQIRVYNTKKQKRPVLDFSVGLHPVRALAETWNG